MVDGKELWGAVFEHAVDIIFMNVQQVQLPGKDLYKIKQDKIPQAPSITQELLSVGPFLGRQTHSLLKLWPLAVSSSSS